jgi:hypothetical protein
MALFSFLLMLSCVGWLLLCATRPRKLVHYILIIQNTHPLVEWKIRRCFFNSWLRGTPIHLSVIDVISNDDTICVVEKLAFRYPISLYVVDDDNQLQQIVQELTMRETSHESYIIYNL